MSTPLDIANYLETNGLGTYGTNIFTGSEPPGPDDSVTIYEYPGQPPSLKAGLEFPNINIRTRSLSWETARAKLQAIQDLLQQ